MEGDSGIATSLIQLREHDQVPSELSNMLREEYQIVFKPTDYEGVPVHLGMSGEFQASYYIGTDWLTPQHPMVVLPKVEGIDIIEMFRVAAQLRDAGRYFSKFYGMDTTARRIPVKGDQDYLSPLLVFHFVSLLKELAARGLKQDYVRINEDLVGKVKGKLCVSRNIVRHDSLGRFDRRNCSYFVYTENIPENQLLKTALCYCKQSLDTMPSLRGHRSYPLLEQDINRLLSGPFAEVQEDLTIRTIPRGHSRRLFKEYPEALSVAGMILKRYGFSYEEISRSTSVPPHWIDMTRLFELYVYAILRERFPGMIEFQVPGHFGTQADFVKRDEYLVVDAKYKFHYESGEVLDDIRQLSGYARDKRILRHFENGAKGLVPACLIIYPNKIEMKGDDVRVIPGSDEVLPDGASRLLDEADSIESFENFYKMAIPLPLR